MHNIANEVTMKTLLCCLLCFTNVIVYSRRSIEYSGAQYDGFWGAAPASPADTWYVVEIYSLN